PWWQGKAEPAPVRGEQPPRGHAEALRSRAAAEAEAAEATETLARLREDFQVLQDRVAARREELATMSERLVSAQSIEQRLSEEISQASDRVNSLRQQHGAL